MTADGADACFDFAAACCRSPAARNGAVADAAPPITDWPRALRLLRRHRIEALAYAALTAAAAELPEDVVAALRRRAQEIAQHNLVTAAESARLQDLLDAAGIRALHLKGMALAQLAYGSIALKFSQDIDLLVAPADAAAAIRCLEGDAWRLTRPLPALDARQWRLMLRYGREVALQHRAGGRPVEVRWQLVNSPSLLRGVGAQSPSRDVMLANGAILRTLNDDDLFAYLCVHGAGHGWSRLQWLADLNAFMARLDEPALMRVWRHAEAVGAGTCAALAVLLCRRLLGYAPPPDVAQAAMANKAARMAAPLALAVMRAGDAGVQRFASTRIVLMQVLFGSSPRHYVDFARELGFRVEDILALPLPAPLHAAYPLARLPLWLWRKAAMAPKRGPRNGVG